MVFNNKHPKSVLEYYVHLYSRKKLKKESHGSKKKIISEATLSWLKLSSKKRQIITTRFQSQQLKLKKNFADKLRTVEPISRKIFEAEGHNIILNLQNTDNLDISKCTDVCEDLTKFNNTTTPNASWAALNESEKQENDLIQQTFPALMLEPNPPAFRSNKDFYYLLNTNTENLILWDKLSRREKGQYERAATRIRRNYIQSYTSFLETLTSIELFNHYKNVTDV